MCTLYTYMTQLHFCHFEIPFEEDMRIMGMRQWRKQCKERAEWKRVTDMSETDSGL
jgi:hypothetical protein